MSVILLRVRGGLDYSAHIVDEELVEPEVMTMIRKIIITLIIVIIIIMVIVIIIVMLTIFTFLRICSRRTPH